VRQGRVYLDYSWVGGIIREPARTGFGEFVRQGRVYLDYSWVGGIIREPARTGFGVKSIM
jgi:hypothetical protein